MPFFPDMEINANTEMNTGWDNLNSHYHPPIECSLAHVHQTGALLKCLADNERIDWMTFWLTAINLPTHKLNIYAKLCSLLYCGMQRWMVGWMMARLVLIYDFIRPSMPNSMIFESLRLNDLGSNSSWSVSFVIFIFRAKMQLELIGPLRRHRFHVLADRRVIMQTLRLGVR